MYNIYKPTRKNTGTALGFQASDRDASLYVTLIKQVSWNEATKEGSFKENRRKPGFNTILKFNITEAGTLIDAIEKEYQVQLFHNSAKGTTQIEFGPAEAAENEAPSCFVLRVFQTSKEDKNQKNSFFIPISFGEVRTIKEYLVHYMHKSFRAKAQPKGAILAQEQMPPDAQAEADAQQQAEAEGQAGEQTSDPTKW
jgi:hypothetical protein